MRHPFDFYVRLWENVSRNNERCSPGQAAARLERYFGGSAARRVHDCEKNITGKRPVTVCVLDEIDYLVTSKQTVLYNLFDWPLRGSTGKSEAQLVIVGISNTVNLPERLHPRVQSRLGRERCIFGAYSPHDCVKILKSKLGVSNESVVSLGLLICSSFTFFFFQDDYLKCSLVIFE